MTRVPGEADARDYAGGAEVGEKRRGDFLSDLMFSMAWRCPCSKSIHHLSIVALSAPSPQLWRSGMDPRNPSLRYRSRSGREDDGGLDIRANSPRVKASQEPSTSAYQCWRSPKGTLKVCRNPSTSSSSGRSASEAKREGSGGPMPQALGRQSGTGSGHSRRPGAATALSRPTLSREKIGEDRP
jgi:hypothetical protein